jgi:hypothetical protein
VLKGPLRFKNFKSSTHMPKMSQLEIVYTKL